jgi:PAS domain S-box-containing protein
MFKSSNHKFLFSPLDTGGAGKNLSTLKPSNGQSIAEARIDIKELQKANEELRQARRAALNLMEDAIQSKEALAKSEERYRTLFESIDEGFCIFEIILNEEGKPVDLLHLEANPSYEKKSGLHGIVGKRILEVLPDIEQEWIDFYADVAFTGNSARQEYYVSQLGGWFTAYASRVGGEGSLQVAIVFDDITERKKAETALRESEERKEFLLKLNDTIRQLSDPVEIQYEASRLVAEQLKADRVHFAELTEDEQLVIRKDYVRGNAPSLAGALKPKMIAAAVKLERDEPVIITDVEAFPLFSKEEKAELSAAKIRSQLSVALTKHGKKVASFAVDQTQPRKWTELEVSILQEAAERTLAAVEKAKAEEALRKSELRLRTLADAVPQVIWTNDAEGKANYFNQRWHEYSGLTYEQSAGLGWEAIVHPDDAPASSEKWKTALAKGEIFDTEYRLCRHDGVYCWFIGRNVPLKDYDGNVVGWFGSATDIEDLKKALEALSQSEARLRITMESATDYAIITMDTERKVERWSSGATQIFGYSEEKMIGQSADIIFTEEDRNAGVPSAELETARVTGRAADERWHKRKDGSRFYANGVMRPIQNNHLTGYVKVLRDMTQQQLFTEQLHRLVAERTIELQRSNEDLRQFAHVASHDLKEPIRKIQTFNNRILDEYADVLPSKAKIYSQKIGTSADRMISMVEGVLRYSKLANTEQVLEPVDMNEIIEQITIDLEVMMEQKKAQLTKGELPTVTANATLIYQLFYNLILNSLKFSKEDESSHINISSETTKLDDQNFIRIVLSDNGIGFEPEFGQEIFKTFTRLHPAEDYEGTGLGLALCKKIVERQRGTITANGQPDKGATFTIMLPL